MTWPSFLLMENSSWASSPKELVQPTFFGRAARRLPSRTQEQNPEYINNMESRHPLAVCGADIGIFGPADGGWVAGSIPSTSSSSEMVTGKMISLLVRRFEADQQMGEKGWMRSISVAQASS